MAYIVLIWILRFSHLEKILKRFLYFLSKIKIWQFFLAVYLLSKIVWCSDLPISRDVGLTWNNIDHRFFGNPLSFPVNRCTITTEIVPAHFLLSLHSPITLKKEMPFRIYHSDRPRTHHPANVMICHKHTAGKNIERQTFQRVSWSI